MSDNTKIEWCDATWNPIVGCTPVSEGCAHCYAARMASRFPKTFGGVAHGTNWTGKVHFRKSEEETPLHWRKPRRVFVCSMGDLFHERVPYDWIDRVYSTMALCRQHTFLLLTKRPERALAYAMMLKTGDPPQDAPRGYVGQYGLLASYESHELGYLDNVWYGVSAENQEQADQRIPLMLQTPAAKRFVSIEPMLGPIDFLDVDSVVSQSMHPGLGYPADGIEWVIVGGETGPGARPMHPNWVRRLRDQCSQAEIPFFFKGWGDWVHEQCLSRDKVDRRTVEDRFFVIDQDHSFFRVGKKRAGRLLDGRTHDDFPST